MKNIRELVRREAIASGYEPALIEEASATAESMYEQMAGVPLENMRSVGDLFRQYETAGDVEGLFEEIDNETLRANVENLYGQTQNPTGMLGMLGGQPGAIQQLYADLNPMMGQAPQESGGGSPWAEAGKLAGWGVTLPFTGVWGALGQLEALKGLSDETTEDSALARLIVMLQAAAPGI